MLTEHSQEPPGALIPVFTHLLPATFLLHFIDDLPLTVASLQLCLWQSFYQLQDDHLNYYPQVVPMWPNQSRSLSSGYISETHPGERVQFSDKPKMLPVIMFPDSGKYIWDSQRTTVLWYHCNQSKCKPIVTGMLVSVFKYQSGKLFEVSLTIISICFGSCCRAISEKMKLNLKMCFNSYWIDIQSMGSD